MPYSVPFVKINAEGHFGSSGANIVERWQAGFHITKNGGVVGGTSELTSFLTNIRTALTNYHGITAVAAGANAWLDAVSGAYIGTDGHYALGQLQSTTRVALATPVAGSGGSAVPWTTACVISLRSLLLRGPGSHGRVYWPAAGATINGPTGVIPSAQVDTLVTSGTTLLNAINTQASLAFGSGTNVGLVSPKGTGFQSPVVRVGYGQKYDHMESRERDIPEAHKFGTLTLAAALLDDLDDDFRRRMQELVDEE